MKKALIVLSILELATLLWVWYGWKYGRGDFDDSTWTGSFIAIILAAAISTLTLILLKRKIIK